MKLRLKNAKGIKAGPALDWSGLDEIEIDFTGRTGLIAFSGENGGGKSSCLENCHNYPQLVSRDGALWQHFLGRTAEKEFISTFMGHEYRSVIKMDAEQGKQEGYLWRDGIPMVNGKISAYKKVVEDIFGQPFTYFRSQFCPQKSKKTSDMQIDNMTPGVFRSLLREFLNLQRYDTWETTAKQIANHFQEQVAGISGKAAVLQAVVVGKQQADLDRCAAGDKAGFLQDEKTELQHSLEERRQKVDELKAAIQQNAVAQDRKKDLQQQIDRLETELAKEKQAADSEIEKLSATYRNIKNGISDCNTILASKDSIEAATVATHSLEREVIDLVALLEQLNSTHPVQQHQCHKLETQLAQIRQQAKDLENDPAIQELDKKILETETTIKTIEREIKDLETDFQIVALRAEIKSLERAALVGDGIDATCQSVTCAAIKSVNEAKEKLPTAIQSLTNRIKEVTEIAGEKIRGRDQLKTGRDEYVGLREERSKTVEIAKSDVSNRIKTTLTELDVAKQGLLSTTKLLTIHQQDLAKKRGEIAKQKSLADQLPEIKISEQRKADLEKQLLEITTQGTEKKRLWAETEAAKCETIKGIRETQLAIVMTDASEESLRIFLAGIEEIEKLKIPAVEKQIQEARDRMATLQAELRRIEAAETELRDIEAQREALVRNMTSWRYLQFGCGKTGLQNLRIDGAAPRIVYNANRLLSQAYGALYSIRLETINDSGKEDLQIKIIMENGQEVYLDDVSGGQRQWLVQALWLAMSLLNQEKSGRKYDYFCSDESDGSLDQGNADKYTALYRPFMADAGLDRFIFISHRESCRAAADHILQFEHGKNPRWE